MKLLESAPNLLEKVHGAILSEIAAGRLQPGSRVIQEKVARDLGVSRQPVQLALALLRTQGVLRDAPGRGLQVAPIDLDYVLNMYEMRAVIEGLASRQAALRNAPQARSRGPALIQRGRKAVAAGSVKAMIAADMAFHGLIYELADNPLVAPTMETHWTYTQRVMGEVLMRDETPRDIWDQHEALLQAIGRGDGAGAEQLARKHIVQAASFMIERLRLEAQQPAVVGGRVAGRAGPTAARRVA